MPNWAFVIRKLCLAYPGTTPKDYESLTRDQLYIMMLPEAQLRGLSQRQRMSVQSAIAKGIIQNDREMLGGYRSLAEKLNAEAAEKLTTTPRERRRIRRELQLREQQKRSNNDDDTEKLTSQSDKDS